MIKLGEISYLTQIERGRVKEKERGKEERGEWRAKVRERGKEERGGWRKRDLEFLFLLYEMHASLPSYARPQSQAISA